MYRGSTTGKAVLTAAVAVALWGTARAGEPESDDRMRYLEERVRVLEEQRQEPAAATEESPFTFGALMEVEYSSAEAFGGGRTSDVALATVELSAEARINDWTRAQLVLLYEEDGTEPMDLDVGTLTFGNPDASPWFLTGGRQYVPFGRFETGMVSDPLTLELGETWESALRVGFASEGPYGSVYLFNGDVDEGAREDRADSYGAQLGWASGDAENGFDLGLSWIANLADSDTLQETDNAAASGILADGVVERVAGAALHAVYHAGPFTLIGEYVGATAEFDPADLTFAGAGARPAAWNLEVDYTFDLLGREASIAVGHQRSDEALGIGLPRARSLATLSIGVLEKAAVSFEYALAEDYATTDGGSSDTAGAFTVQFAAEI